MMSEPGVRWRHLVPERLSILMWGAGDQGRVNWHILQSLGCKVVVFVDDTPQLKSPFPSVPLLAGWEEVEPWLREQDVSTLGFVPAIGNPHGHVRLRLEDFLRDHGVLPVSFSEPTALLCETLHSGTGLQVMAQAIVHNDVVVGRQCLLNTRSLVEHDCVLEDGVEVGPGAILCGRVRVGANTWIGAGATVLPRVNIGRDTIIGAGSVVVSDISDGVVAYGVPARPVRENTINHMQTDW